VYFGPSRRQKKPAILAFSGEHRGAMLRPVRLFQGPRDTPEISRRVVQDAFTAVLANWPPVESREIHCAPKARR